LIPLILVFQVSALVDISTLSIAIASASVVVGVVYYALQIRHQARIRQTDLVMRLYSTFSSREFQDAWTKVRTSDFEGLTDI
jgi:hypothetical protein